MCEGWQVRECEFRLDVAMVALAHAAMARHHGDLEAAGLQVERWIHGAQAGAKERMVGRLIARQALAQTQRETH